MRHAAPRSFARRLLVGLNAFVAACLVLTATGYGYVRWRYAQVEKVDLGGVLRKRGDDGGDGSDGSDRSVNVLVVGTDSRENLSAADRKRFGTTSQAGGARTDTIMVVRVEPGTGTVAFLSIPRDLWVPIAETGREDKINAAFNRGGPERLIATIRDALGIELDHYVSIDFSGFRGIVDVLGGVDVYFPAPARDLMSGLDVRRAGCVHLDGDRALDLVRSRELEQYGRGGWRKDGRADLGRIERQQAFIRRVIAKASDAARNPLTLHALLDKAIPKVVIDDGLRPDDIRRLASRFRDLPPEEVDLLDLPVTVGRKGAASVVFLDTDAAGPMLDRMAGRTPASVPAEAPGTTATRSGPTTATGPATTAGPSTTTTTSRPVAAAC